MKIIDGKKLALEIRTELKEKISKLGLQPGLAVILAGDDPASHLYVRLKEKASEEVGIRFEKKIFSESATEEDINSTIQQFNNRSDIHGILVQLPLPPKFDENKIIRTIDPKKDVDGFHPKNLELIKNGHPFIIPGVTLGIMRLIESTKVDLKNKKAALLVNSDIFALPLRHLLKTKDAEVETFIKPKISDFRFQISDFDIIVIALGKPKFLKSEMVRDGAIIIDVGTTKVDGKLFGDADFDSFQNRDVFITPVPGGVGPMTVAMLLNNAVQLASVRASS